ncbi:MAG: AAA family ATPase, partial [Desulfovibrionaceae bacterium]|nr:AAA family ATPase [Desulfovibrionaceae bacterium]
MFNKNKISTNDAVTEQMLICICSSAKENDISRQKREKDMVDLQIGGISFREIRETSCYYADKTAFLEEFFQSVPPKVSIITRPRRFGKTLMMNTLNDFFDITQDSKAIFEGLAISKNKALCDKWMNQYPVVLFSLKGMEGRTFQDALNAYITFIADLCMNLAYLQESPKLRPGLKNLLSVLENRTNDRGLLESSLYTVCSALHAHWNKPVIVLIDEYDAPLARAQENGYYPEMEELYRTMLKKTIQDNDSLQFAVLTGCLRVSKERVFTGIDDIRFLDVSEPCGAGKIGFTQKEVDELLAAAGFSEKKDVIKEWYDGYRFGDDNKVYCPWDILQYVYSLRSAPDKVPESYWADTSGNDAVRILAGRTDCNAAEKIEKLLDGGYVASSISQALTHDTLYASEDNLWTLLYQAGYLTKADPRK